MRMDYGSPIENVAYIRGRLLSTPSISQAGTLVDVHAERALLGTMLEGVTPPEFEAGWIVDAGRLTLFLAIQHLQAAELILHPMQYRNAGDCRRVAFANAELVAHQIDECDIWPWMNGDPRPELVRCVDEATQPLLVDYYAARVRTAWYRRRLLDHAQQVQDAALSPAPLNETEVARCLSV